MKNIALILGAFAGAVPGNRANTIYAKGSTQTDEAAQPLYLPPADMYTQTHTRNANANQMAMNSEMRQPIYGGLQPSQPYQSHHQNPGYATENSYVRQYFNGPIQAAVQRKPFYPQVNGNNNQDHVKGYRPSAGEQPSGQDMFPYGIPPYNTINNPDQANVGDKRDNPEYDDYVDYREEPLRQNKAPVRDQQKKQNPPVKKNNNQDQESQEYQRSAREQPPVQPQVLPTSETKPAKIVASQLNDEEIIDAVLVFEHFDCDVHVKPTVEASQKRVNEEFFNSHGHGQFQGLNRITVKNIACGSMIVHYQAAVQKDLFESISKQDLEKLFLQISRRLSKAFEFPGFQSELTWFIISDVLTKLIRDSVVHDQMIEGLDQLDLPFMKNRHIPELLAILGQKKFMELLNKTGEKLVEAAAKKYVSDWKQTLDAAENLISKHLEDKAESETEGESPVDPIFLSYKEFFNQFLSTKNNKQKPMEVPNQPTQFDTLTIPETEKRILDFFFLADPTKQKQNQEPNQYEHSDVSAEEERATNEWAMNEMKDYGQQLKETFALPHDLPHGWGDPEGASDMNQYEWSRY